MHTADASNEFYGIIWILNFWHEMQRTKVLFSDEWRVSMGNVFFKKILENSIYFVKERHYI